MGMGIGLSPSSIGSIYRSKEYYIYSNEDGVDYIVGKRQNKKTDLLEYNPSDYYPDILIDIISLYEDMPSPLYFDWSIMEREKGNNNALRFYNKYGHLDLFEFCEYSIASKIISLHTNNENDDFFYPIKAELEDYYEWQSRSDNDTSDRPFLSYGEPIWLFYDIVWLTGYMSYFLNRAKNSKPLIYSLYYPTKKDNIEHLVSYFDFQYNSKLYNYPIEDLKEKYGNSFKITEKEIFYINDEKFNYPDWNFMMELFALPIDITVKNNLNSKGELILYTGIATLIESIFLFIYLDIDKKRYSEIRYCKNCNKFLYDDNPKREYCNEQCRSAYGTRKWREKKAKKEGESYE